MAKRLRAQLKTTVRALLALDNLEGKVDGDMRWASAHAATRKVLVHRLWEARQETLRNERLTLLKEKAE